MNHKYIAGDVVHFCLNCETEMAAMCKRCSIEEEFCENCHPAHVVKARSRADARKIGIHLLTPDETELDRAQDDAWSKGFKTIYVHTKRTWPKGESK